MPAGRGGGRPRLPAMDRAGIPLGTIVGGRGADPGGVAPGRVNRRSYNDTHLMEQPRLFHARDVILGVTGARDGTKRTHVVF